MGKGEKILALIAIILAIIGIILQYFDWAKITPESLVPYTQFIFWLFLAIIVIIVVTLAFYLAWKKSSPKKAIEPNFNHLEAWLFYPKKFSWGQGERDPKKHVPRQKVILIKDLKKAYYIGDYVLNLILAGKISWFTDDEQGNLDEWCTKKGYTPPSEEATEDKLFEPYFKAEIVGKKDEYRKGETVQFRTFFRGSLKHGFVDNRINNLEFKTFRIHWYSIEKKSHVFSYDPDTLKFRYKFLIPNFLIRGRLGGYVNKKFEWGWVVPYRIPSGKYKICMRVYDKWLVSTAIRESEDIITIV